MRGATRMWQELLADSLRRPRVAARRILDARPAPAFIVEAALLVTTVGILLGSVALRLSVDGVDMVSATVLANPLLGAAIQLAAMALIVLLTARIGRLFGGTGGVWDAAALIVWLNAVLVLVQAAQIVALLLAPPAASVLAILAIVWSLWAYASFVAELHGFRHPLMVLGAAILTLIMLFFATSMLAAMLGLTGPEV